MKLIIKGLFVFALSFALQSNAEAPTTDIPYSTPSTLSTPIGDVIESSTVKVCEVSVKDCIRYFFPEKPEIAIAVFTGESGLNASAIGYNCRYGTLVTTCKKSDRNKAISHDYGIAQINSQHDENPQKYLNIVTNLTKARELYDQAKGFSPWYVYTNKLYVKYL